ncbi:MAG: T9SS type A sorting domain-containing protein [Chitinophagales bacterium]
MKKICFGLFLACVLNVNAQTNAQVERNLTAPLKQTVNFSDPALQDWEPFLLTIKEQPKPASDYGNKKALLMAERRNHHISPAGYKSGRSAIPAPVMLNNFTANNAQGTPNDNHMAVSNDGKVVSVVNTNIRVYNETGTQLLTKTLSTFANALGIFTDISDPRVIYDPVADRFIVVFFSGSTSTTSKIIVAFSQSNDPAQQWNFYALSGNMLNDTTWSDYPIVTISDKDLFMAFNHLKDGQDWKTGFRYSAIWQIDKQRGYNGDTLQFDFWHNIVFNGKPVWSVCPVQGGSAPSGPETYFLSVRPGDLSNDTVFLHTISNSHQSGSAQFSSKALKANVPYGLPPNAYQKGGQYLATNDARVLCGFYENNKIQYVQNTIDPSTFTAAVYVGEVDAPSSASPAVTAQIVSNDTVDYGYPSIAYIGNNQWDNRALITCSYSSPDTFPGTVAFYKDANGNVSEMLIVKKGEREIDVLADSVERWGDYSGIQRKYNEPNTAWLAGSYAYPSQAYRTWLAKVVNSDSAVVSAIKTEQTAIAAKVYPNPASEKFNLQIEVPKDNYLNFYLLDVNGRPVHTLLQGHFKAGTANFSFNTQYLASGTYFLQITDKNNLLRTEKIIITR